VFSTVSHFHPSLIIGKAGAYQSGANFRTQRQWLAPSLAYKYCTRVEEIESVKTTTAYYDTAKNTAVTSFVVKVYLQI
jgi:hypothetical protein